MGVKDGLADWPEDVAKRYRDLGFWNGMTLGRYLWQSAERFGDKEALTDGDVRISYRELAVLSDGLAERLSERGFGREDCIVVQLPNCWEFVVLLFACARIGVVPIMALPGHRSLELSFFVEHAGAKAIAVPDEIRGFDHQAMAWEVAKKSSTLEDVFVVGENIGDGSVDLRGLITSSSDPQALRGRLDLIGPHSNEVALFLLSGGTTGLPKPPFPLNRRPQADLDMPAENYERPEERRGRPCSG